MQTVTIYTDGSCLGNPGPGGWGVLILKDGKKVELSGGEKATTNNRMEMMAIIKALEWLHKNLPAAELRASTIALYSDSNLLIQTLNQGWKRKANLDLWAELDRLRAWLKIKWQWVKGHASDKNNHLVDRLAVKAATRAKNS